MKSFLFLVAIWACVQANIIRIPLKKVELTQLNGPGDDSIIPLYNIADTDFVGEISIGNPPQLFNISFDTSTANLYVISSKCPRKDKNGNENSVCVNLNKYDAQKSSTYIKDGTEIVLPYSFGNLTGVLSVDQVSIGNAVAYNQTFAEMIEIPEKGLKGAVFDGVLGLGFPTLSVLNVPPVFDVMFSQNSLSKAVFSFYFTKKNNQPGSELVLGGIDEAHYKGDITYLPVTKTNFWQFSMDKVIVGKTTFCKNGCQVFIDTGSPYVRGPADKIKEINDLIGATYIGNNLYSIGCDNLSSKPKATFVLAGRNFTLLPEDYVLKVDADDGTVSCMSLFSTRNPPPGSPWVFGGAFLGNFYSIYDRENSQVGFATMNN